MPGKAIVSQALIDVGLLRNHIDTKGLLDVLNNLPPLSKVATLASPKGMEASHPYLILLGKLACKKIYIGLGLPLHPGQAPRMDLWVEEADNTTGLALVPSSELESVAMVQPFRDCWAGMLKKTQSREEKGALDCKRGAIKGLACWYFLRHAAKTKEEFRVFDTLRKYLVLGLSAVAIGNSEANGKKKGTQSIATASSSKKATTKNPVQAGTHPGNQSNARDQAHQRTIANIRREQRQETETTPTIRETAIEQAPLRPITTLNNNDSDRPTQPVKTAIESLKSTQATPSTSSSSPSQVTSSTPSQVVPSPPSQVAAEQGFCVLGKLVDTERELAARREDLKRQREDLDTRIQEVERDIATKRLKIKALAVGLSPAIE
ncbi:hypothetical protein BDV96DRAFT_594832 [Lophiotrema nucula]|uniref:Uncharacterized protein n=1 Tax=Lophiotrema nucula TaxID=690887 RepID=A0A6A5ZS20_9PLEO|nr:hypothetical protein BDV96DRAFT_594832 [Lophiotrema nucula]